MPTAEAIQAHLDALTKPPGSLGRLEDLAARLCAVQDTLRPVTRPRRAVLFAGDHGVVDEGVTAWPSAVTSQMIANIRAGGAASSVLARTSETELELVDVGSLSDLDDGAPRGASGDGESRIAFFDRRLRRGSANLARADALDAEAWLHALDVGRQRADAAAADGMRIVAAGEMGIGNTTPASCLTALLADVDPALAIGRGAGADDATLQRKRWVVGAAVERARGRLERDPDGALRSIAGHEIAAMAGFYLGAADHGLTIVLDGFVTTAAALIADRLAPGIANSMIAAHRSAEPAHGLALAALGLDPMLDWRLRLGEGTGALLLMPLLDAAAATLGEMATFSSAGIPTGEA